MKIWAHRGCSQRYPENTLLAFEKAAGIPELTGIELDIQLTKDGYLVVCHDERVDRTTDGIGYVKDFTLEQLKRLKIEAGNGRYEQIPTIVETLELLEDRLQKGFKINIELKNSKIPYQGRSGMPERYPEQYCLFQFLRKISGKIKSVRQHCAAWHFGCKSL